MSGTATKRMNELNFRPKQSLSKSEKTELEGLQRQYDRPDLLISAKKAQQSGGVLASHAVALTKIADDRDICICIRSVNPLATGLV